MDDHPASLAGIRAAFAGVAHIELAGEARSVHETLRLLSGMRSPAEVLVVEPGLPGGAGLSLIRSVARTGPAVLAVSHATTDDAILDALRAGAKGYLTKGASTSELLRAITVVAEGGAVFSPAVAARLTAFFSARHLGPGPAALADLTERELEVLDRLARGWNNQRIAKDLVLTEKSVRNYVWRVIAKLKAGHRARAAALAREAGLGSAER